MHFLQPLGHLEVYQDIDHATKRNLRWLELALNAESRIPWETGLWPVGAHINCQERLGAERSEVGAGRRWPCLWLQGVWAWSLAMHS